MKHISMKRLYQWSGDYLIKLHKHLIKENSSEIIPEEVIDPLKDRLNDFLQYVWDRAKQK